MVHVDGNLNIDNYNDNTGSLITVSPQGTVVEQTVVTQPSSPQETKSEESGTQRPIRLNPDAEKIDFIRVINAMCEYGFFTTPSGVKAYKKDVFAALGTLLNENFYNYQKNLSESKVVNNDSSATTKIFEALSKIALHHIEK